MNTLNEQLDLFTQLSKLVQETCSLPRDSLERKKKLNNIIFLMQKSGKIWLIYTLFSIYYSDSNY